VSDRVRPVVVVIYGSGTVISRQAHHCNRHPGPFEFCLRCGGAFRSFPDTDAGIAVYNAGRLVEESALVRRLLVA
jgi:hypothetical protein